MRVRVKKILLKVGNLVSFCKFIVENQQLTKQPSDDCQRQSFSLRSRKLRKYSVLLMSLTRIWMLNWVKTYVYHLITAMENVAGIVREGFLRVKSWRSLVVSLKVCNSSFLSLYHPLLFPDFVIVSPRNINHPIFLGKNVKNQVISRIRGRACYFTRLFARHPKQQR